MAQVLSVVHIFISGKSPKYGLPQHPDQSMSAILASACVGERITRHRAEAQRVVQFPVGQQSGVGGDDRTTKLEHQAAVEIGPENFPSRFTRRGRHSRLFKASIGY
jgi:hypothetical protein